MVLLVFLLIFIFVSCSSDEPNNSTVTPPVEDPAWELVEAMSDEFDEWNVEK
jgi:hypothetical protein